MSGPYKCPIGWTSSTPWKYCNEYYLEKVSVTGTDDNGIFISPYLWFHSFHYIVKTLVYFYLYFFPPCWSSHLGVLVIFVLYTRYYDDCLQANGKLKPELFWNDDLYLSKTGYQKFATSWSNFILLCNTFKSISFDLRNIKK